MGVGGGGGCWSGEDPFFLFRFEIADGRCETLRAVLRSFLFVVFGLLYATFFAVLHTSQLLGMGLRRSFRLRFGAFWCVRFKHPRGSILLSLSPYRSTRVHFCEVDEITAPCITCRIIPNKL